MVITPFSMREPLSELAVLRDICLQVWRENAPGYMHKAALIQDLSAVTAACMMVKRQVFEEVQGFEEQLSVAFNDVDFCFGCGKRSIW